MQCSNRGAPEEYAIKPHLASEDGLPSDAIKCTLIRLSTTLSVLEDCGHEGYDGGFRVSHEVVMGLLWGMRGYVDQLQYLHEIEDDCLSKMLSEINQLKLASQ